MSLIPFQLATLRTTRRNMVQILNQHSLDQLNHIPPGFRNNLFWNAAHILATQQLLTYGLSHQEFGVPQLFIDSFRKGTAPARTYGVDDLEFVREYLIQSPEILESDYQNGIFNARFQTYPTSYGIQLNSIDDAICFNNVHEGLHLGYCMALQKNL